MHGEVSSNGSRLTAEQIDREQEILKGAFKQVVLPDDAPLADLKTKVNAWIKALNAEAEESGGMSAPENDHLPVGYTYFGQLLAHDITSHRFLGVEKPSLRLQTVYGLGPAASPQFYEHAPDSETGYAYRGIKFDLDTYKHQKSGKTVHDFKRINPRQSETQPERTSGVPLMADARNDQNFIIAQMTVEMMRIHNKYAAHHYAKDKSNGEVFKDTATELIHQYQRVILTDYLPKILYNGANLLLDLVNDPSKFKIYDTTNPCVLSEIFSKAALRYGHTQVRQMYQTEIDGGLIHLFGSSFDLRGFVRDLRRKIDWACLLARVDGEAFQPAKAFDTRIVLTMDNLPFLPNGKDSLIQKNIESSVYNFTLSDQSIKVLYAQIFGNNPAADIKSKIDTWNIINKWQYGNPNNLETPLWIFILLESEYWGGGKTLGPIGSQIIAEQIVWLLQEDLNSVLWSGGHKVAYENIAQLTLSQLLMETIGQDLKMDGAVLKEIHSTRQLTPSVKDTLAPSDLDISNIKSAKRREIYDGTEPGIDMSIAEEALKVKTFVAGDPGKWRRSHILANGFYRYPANVNPSSLKKEEIRVYASNTMILKHCNPSLTISKMANLTDVTGVFFIFGLYMEDQNGVQTFSKDKAVSSEIFLLARRTGYTGSLGVTVDDAWLFSKSNLNIANTEDAMKYSLAFGKDGYETMRDKGMDPQVFNLKDLLGLIGYDKTQEEVLENDRTIAISLIEVKGSDIAAAEGFTLDAAVFEEDALSENQQFFGLKLSSTNGQRAVDSAPGRPYPPYCYAKDIIWR